MIYSPTMFECRGEFCAVLPPNTPGIPLMNKWIQAAFLTLLAADSGFAGTVSFSGTLSLSQDDNVVLYDFTANNSELITAAIMYRPAPRRVETATTPDSPTPPVIRCWAGSCQPMARPERIRCCFLASRFEPPAAAAATSMPSAEPGRRPAGPAPVPPVRPATVAQSRTVPPQLYSS